MSEPRLPGRSERIVVALDASPQSERALRAAVELAALLDAELEGLFVEDINLLHLCGLPFGSEIGSYTAERRSITSASMERQLRALATANERAIRRAAARRAVRWNFHVRRGSVVDELLGAAKGAALMSVGRAGGAGRRGIGSTVWSLVGRSQQPLLIAGERGGLELPLTVLYTGTPAAGRALELALRLARVRPGRLRVVVWPGGEPVRPDPARGEPAGGYPARGVAELEEEVRRLTEAWAGPGGGALEVLRPERVAHLSTALRRLGGGTLVLPGEQAALVPERGPAVLLVP